MTTRESPTASRVAASARWVIPSAVESGRSGGVLVLRSGQAEKDDPGDTQPTQAFDLHGQGVEAVLHHAGKRRDGTRLGQSVGHEEGCHQIIDAEA